MGFTMLRPYTSTFHPLLTFTPRAPSTDCGKIYEGVLHIHNVWTAPLEALAIIALLLSLTKGIYGLPALGIVIFVLPLQYYFGLRMARYKLETVEVSDSRVLRMQEVGA